MSVERIMTMKASGKTNVFGALPWVIALRKTFDAENTWPCVEHTLKGSPCRNEAGWVYHTLDGALHKVCFAHLHRHLGTDAEQERLHQWMSEVRYWDLNGTFTSEEDER